jgi:hypothetical protein
MNKPPTAAGYSPGFTAKVRATCLYVATKLGDLIDDTVVVGGLVPSLIIDVPADAHVGTTDLDIGLGFQADVRGLVLDFVEACRKYPT